jgi:hypothetical protein
VGAREYDPRTARWLQRDPAGAAGGHPNLYVYPRNDPVNWIDGDGLQHKRKSLEECEELLIEIESKLRELSKDVENAIQGKSPLADLQGEIGAPGGHMCELEQRMQGISSLWDEFFKSGCGDYDELKPRRNALQKTYENLQRRVAKWVKQLENVNASLIRKLIQGLKNPEVRKWVIRFLRRMAKFVPYIGHIITIIFFIYDWYTSGFWGAVKGLVASEHRVPQSLACGVHPTIGADALAKMQGGYRLCIT